MSTPLTESDRSTDLAALLKNGWAMDSTRDAIRKTYFFKNLYFLLYLFCFLLLK